MTALQAQLKALRRWGSKTPADLSKIHQPVLVANGDSDRMVPSKNTHDLARRLPNSDLIIYPDSGHGGGEASRGRASRVRSVARGKGRTPNKTSGRRRDADRFKSRRHVLLAPRSRRRRIGCPALPSRSSRRSGSTSPRMPVPPPPIDSLTPSSIDSRCSSNSLAWVETGQSSATACARWSSSATSSTVNTIRIS